MSKAQSSSKTAPKNISVFLRVRPPVPREKSHTFNNISYNPRDDRAIIIQRKSGAKMVGKEYLFNKVFKPDCTQQEVYQSYARPAVEAAFDGQHGVLFVYGQTGSGKTFTISNEDKEKPGVLQQAMTEIFDKIAKDTDYDYELSVSYVQLYNEILTDLLDDQKGRVRIQMGTEGRGDVELVTEAAGLSIEHPVTDYKSAMQQFHIGMSRKEMQSTSMNMTSSRSHTIFNLNIKRSAKVKALKVSDGGIGEPQAGPTVALEGRLVLCDLAGSERVSKTKAEGKTLNEATHINGSLLVLGKVVAALTEPNCQHAPFRESKLTRILQYSLLGNGNTSLVVNISPSDDNTEESLSAVGFGQRAIQIKQDAKRHEVLDYKVLYMQLMAELDAKNDGTLEEALREERGVYEDRITALEQQVQTLTIENDLLTRENTALRGGMPPEKLKQVLASMPPASAAGKGAAGKAGAGDWNAVNSNLKEMVATRDAQLKKTSMEREKLALSLAETKRTVFQLAQKLRDVYMRYNLDRNNLARRVDDLGHELAAAKGTDYIGVAMGDFNSSPTGVSSSDSSMSSPRSLAKHGEVYLAEELDAANKRISALRNERIEFLVYQAKAQQAIRMLHTQLQQQQAAATRSQAKSR